MAWEVDDIVAVVAELRRRGAVASTIAAAGLTSTPSIEGFTDAFTVFTVVAAVAAVVSLRLVSSGTPQMTGAPHAP